MPKRSPRGPKCKVCGAVMSPEKDGGPAVCWYEGSHNNIISMRLEAAEKIAAKNRKKKKEER